MLYLMKLLKQVMETVKDNVKIQVIKESLILIKIISLEMKL